MLDGIDLNLDQGEHVGLIGKNGCGKSTLAKILAGIEQADSGDFAVRRDAKVLYLAQEPALDPERTVIDTVLSGLEVWWDAKQRYERASLALERGEHLDASLAAQASAMSDLEHHGGFDVTHRAESILEALGIRELDAQVGRMSGGERRRVALARLLIAEPDLAILDEPTNHLDMSAIEWLEIYLADVFRGALLLITHDRYFLDAVVDRTVEIERGKTFGYTGGFGDYLAGRSSRLALAERTEQNRQNFLRKELDWLSRSPPARTTKQQARIVRAEEAIQNRPPPKVKKLDLELATSRSGKSILDLDRVCIDTLGDNGPKRRLVTDLTLHFTQGERLGILGPNGCGKSTLLRAILGEHPLTSGRLTLGKNAKIAYLSQHRTGLDEDKSILENVAQGRSHVRIGDRDIHTVSYLENFLFTSAETRKPISALSGGERTRVALAVLLQQQTSLLLLDEPTNDLDLDTLAALEGLLLEHDITAIVVTHDRWFLDRIATAILAFEGDSRLTRYVGNYTSVQPMLTAAARRDAKAQPKPKNEARVEVLAPADSARPAKKAGLSYKEQKELDQIEELIAAADARVSELDAELADPNIYSARTAEVPALISARDKARAESERLMERWAELEEKRAQ